MIDQLLSAYWLRPETALFRSIDIETMKDFMFKSPSLDLGCGDGIFSFIRASGEFALDFDAFQSVGNLNSYFDEVDVFDCYDDEIYPKIIKTPHYRIDYAFDHKENLLKKAKTLGLHRKFILGDANQKLPFNNNYFNAIFSNIIYLLDEPQKVFKEIHRILKAGGSCCVMLPNRTLPESNLYNSLLVKKQQEQFKFLKALDRGKISKVKFKSTNEWTNIIENAGFKIIQHKMHLSKSVMKIWDIGLRPLFPVLHKMVSHLEGKMRIEIKKEWIQTLKMFLEPIAAMDSQLNEGEEPTFHCFILEK